MPDTYNRQLVPATNTLVYYLYSLIGEDKLCLAQQPLPVGKSNQLES